MDLLVCSGCGTRVAGPAPACPLCRGSLRPSVAGTWTGALSADGLWAWDGRAWQPASAASADDQRVVVTSSVVRGECGRCGAPLTESLDGKCRYCRAPLPSLPAQFLPLPMRFTSAVELESEIASALPAGLGRLLMLQCPRCGHRDFEAKSFNRGPYQVRCRQCGSAVSL